MLRWRPTSIVITCEHAGADVPDEWRHLFCDAAAALSTHRGCDLGALGVVERLAAGLAAPAFLSHYTRLLVDLNRSLGVESLFSEFTRDCGANERARIVERYYLPYRTSVEKALQRLIRDSGERVLHLSIHSFTPVLDGQVRAVEVGLLFDPARLAERELCEAWRPEVERALPNDRVRFNEPYEGTADGFTTYLRTVFSDDSYAGIEIELNQARLIANHSEPIRYGAALATSLRATLDRFG